MDSKNTNASPPFPPPVKGPISDEAVDLVWEAAIFSVLPVFTVLGVATNTLNLFVFFRLGLTNSVNTCFFALAFSDVCCLTVFLLVLVAGYIHRMFPSHFLNFQELSSAATWYYRMFYDISTLVTTYIAVQRGCCVLLPFHFRHLFTKGRVLTGILVIYFSGAVFYIPVFATSLLQPVMDYQTNTTQVRLVFSPGRDEIVAAVDILKKFILTFAGEFFAILSLLAIVMGMRSASVFRLTSSHTGLVRSDDQLSDGTNQGENFHRQRDDTAPGISKSELKEKKIVRQVILITVVFIVCNTPQMVASIVGRVVSGVDLFGYNRNVYFLTYTIVNVFELFNCSINFFIYYKFNSKFKDIVDDAICTSGCVE